MTTTERIDLDDDDAVAAFHDVYRQALDRDVDQPYSAREKRVGMRPDEYVDKVVLLARRGADRSIPPDRLGGEYVKEL